jgi:hypothetical protein
VQKRFHWAGRERGERRGKIITERKLLATDPHRPTRTVKLKARKLGGWYAWKPGSSKLKAEQGIGLKAQGVRSKEKKTLCLGELCETKNITLAETAASGP